MRDSHDLLMGRTAPDSLVIEAHPPLSAQERIDVTQLARVGFGYGRKRLILFEDATQICFEGTEATDEEAIGYVNDLTRFRNYGQRVAVTLIANLVSQKIPEMASGESLFKQREEIVEGVREASPSLKLLLGRGPKAALAVAESHPDVAVFDDQVAKLVSQLADPYGQIGGAFVWKTVGSDCVAHARLLEHEGVQVGLSLYGSQDARSVVDLSGVVMPDESLHSFAGADGTVLRNGSDVLAIKTTPEKSVPGGYPIPVKSFIKEAFYAIEVA